MTKAKYVKCLERTNNMMWSIPFQYVTLPTIIETGYPCGCKQALVREELHYKFHDIFHHCKDHSKQRSKAIRKDLNELEAWDNYAP